jgi:conjugative transfer pilus assembly protein TraH
MRLKSFATSMCLFAAGMLAQAPVAQANMQGTLLSMYSAMGAPTVADLPSGTVFSLGYIATRNPIISPNIIAFAPPNISAGCGGINMFFGSWSFINSQQLQQLLKAIGQAAGPFLFQMAVQAMCQQCSSILNNLADKIQQMNQLAHNSCQLAAGIYSGNGEAMLTGSLKSATGMFNSATGSASDFFDGLFGSNNTSNNPSKGWAAAAQDVATSWGYSAVGASTNAPQSGNGACPDFSSSGQGMKIGNMTWKALVTNNASSMLGSDGGLGNGAQTTEILMSLIGTQIVLPSAPQSTSTTPVANASAAGNSTASNAPQNATFSSPYSLSLNNLVDGTPNAVVMQCRSITAPDGKTYEATHGTCGTTGPLSPMGCMSVTADKNHTLSSMGYIGIKNMVSCGLFGYDTTGSAAGCAALPGGAPNGGIASAISNQSLHGTWTPTESQVVALSPIPLIPLLRPVSMYPTLVNALLAQAQPFIVANIAATYGRAVQQAVSTGMQNNNGGWEPPPGYEGVMTNINQQVMAYERQLNGALQQSNEIRAFVNAFSASQHQALPGVNPGVSR